MARSNDPVAVPPRYPTASVFVDESGSRATASKFFVVAAIKVRNPGQLARAIRDVRDRTGFDRELKFAEINRRTIPVYHEIIRVLHESDSTLAATVVRGDVHNPFRQRPDTWRVHAEITSQLLVGCINRRELVGVLIDGISTPVGCSLEDTVRNLTNQWLRNTSVVSAVCLDSHTNDLLQVADLVAGAILHERRLAAGPPRATVSNKGKVALHLGLTFGRAGLNDGRDSRVNIRTYRGRRSPSSGRPSLAVVQARPSAG